MPEVNGLKNLRISDGHRFNWICPQKLVRAQDVGRDTEDPLGMRTRSSLSYIHVDYSDLEENTYKARAVYKRFFFFLCRIKPSGLFPFRTILKLWILQRVSMTPWKGEDEPVERPLPTQKPRKQTTMLRVGFEPTIPVSEQAKTFL
jgi:hypothetical protein